MSTLRLLKLAVALVLATLLGTVAAGTAIAQPAPYPPGSGGSGFTLSLSASVVVQGQSITFTVTGAQPGEVLSATVFSTPRSLGSVTTSDTGTASFTTGTADLALGSHTVVVSGAGGQASATFQVVAPAGAAQASGPPVSSGDGLAFTGAGGVLTIGLAGVMLVVIGAALVLALRRRRTSA